MKLVSRICLIFYLLAATAHRLPAPIVETEENPTPAPEQPEALKRKHSARSTSSSEESRPKVAKTKPAAAPVSQGPTRFDGTWKGTKTKKSPGSSGNYVLSRSYTLIIKDGKTADLITESTLTPPRGAAEYYKGSNHSDNLTAAGSDLIIRFSGGRLIDWKPKTVPRDQAQNFMESETGQGTSVFTLKGDELVGGGGAVYHRAR